MFRPLAWLRSGWQDLVRAGWISLAHGLVLSLTGLGIMVVAHQRFWLLAGALSGFLVIAPALATSLYAISRALERGEPVRWRTVSTTWWQWQTSHGSRWGHDYWCMVQFGALLALAATGWVMTSASLITLLAPVPIRTPADFLHHVVLAPDSSLFTLWLALGSLMAAPMFASSVVAMPLMLDRRVTLWQAVLTSWQTVLRNPVTLALWAALITGLTLLGLASFMVALVVVMPVLGHASWHAYRELVDSSGLPDRSVGQPGTEAL